ncbi:gliding motility-associated C-terminal domain-containing protein [Ancylomarina euxinus]|uniref:Gliding motility-associated C-terminal domain-containing protein n=1 Tax=Ancylomarina euxinus TaxID=2283627 RepID=A0A425Y811_9BACT|nr:gliding motility-associated C-terminal domain-containing protein [Ancylomarina euxinus]MCZ4693512.1 gliding motility-associated C-terminal domain-containing protein [Ancylomarina euxinus]MUP13739.1 T9SS type B sorting domain-containing protein [Ancylomarina euxinus]RRG24623.1 gliding motility-associated C-terminal domain-containing protein [Ancylomarina euxinus]
MPKHILLSYSFKLYTFLFSLTLLANTVQASQITPNSSIIVSANDSKLCLGESTIVTLSTTEIGVQYQLKDNYSDVFVSNTILGNNLEASFEPISPSTNSSYTVVATHIATSESINLSPNILIEVLSLPKLDLNISPSHSSLCVGENTSLTIHNSEVDVLYQIAGGANTSEASFSGNGSSLLIDNFEPFRSATYHVNALRNECQTTVPLTQDFHLDVRLPPETQLHIYSDKRVICEGENVLLSLSPSDPSADYQLLDGESKIGEQVTGNGGFIDFGLVSPTLTTTYSIDAKGHFCIDPIRVDFTFKVDVHHPANTSRQLISNKTEVCEGEALIISVVDSQEEVIYQLHDGTNFLDTQIIGNGGKASFPEVYPENNTSYFAYAREMVCPDKLKLNNQVDLKLVKTNGFPIENFATPGEICLGEALDIELPLTENNVTYHLYDKNISVESITSDGGPVVFENLIADIDSRYKILIDNCVDEVIAAEPKLEIHSTPYIDIITTDEINGSDGKVNVLVNGGKAPYTYIFENYKTLISDDHYIELSDMKAGDYKLAVVDANSCKSTSLGHEFRIDFSNSKDYAINGILTPNGDGRNDNWTISYKTEWDAPEVSIFNIYGQEVYHSHSYQNDWQGTFNSSRLPNGSYFYLIEFHRNDIAPIKGILSILGK